MRRGEPEPSRLYSGGIGPAGSEGSRLPSDGLARMSYFAIAALALVGLLLLTALVAFGIGSRRWNWAAVVASFLIVLTFGGYLYLAARLLHFEWEWAQAERATRLRLYRTRDALAPSSNPGDRGRLVKLASEKSISELREDEARWRRALERVETWRGTYWDNARFDPPEDNKTAATLTLPAPQPAAPPDGDAGEPVEPGEPAVALAPREPPAPGATIYLFDTRPIAEGGRYLGGWTVTDVAGQQLTLEPTTPPDDEDRAAWRDRSGTVTVYDELPADRWVAFSETPRSTRPALEEDEPAATAASADAVTPQPTLDLDRLKSDEKLTLPENLEQALADHTLTAVDVRKSVPEEEWPALQALLEAGGTEALPGEYWAEIRFDALADLEDFLGFAPDIVDGVEPSLSIEVDLESAFQAQKANDATIVTVFHRRRLLDTGTLVNGSLVPVGDKDDEVVMAEGLSALMRSLERDIAILTESQTRLTAATQATADEQKLIDTELEALESDLRSFTRDADAATSLADAFEAETERVSRQLGAAEQAVIDLGEKLDVIVREAVEKIDRIAPPPQARGGRAGPAAF